MEIRFLGIHNAESKNSRLVSFLIDGILALETGSLTSELTFGEQRAIKAVLLSHAHYDHIRGTPALALNHSNHGANRILEIFGTSRTLRILQSHLIDGLIYPEFAAGRSYLGKPAIKLKPVETYRALKIDQYRVKALPVLHPIEAIGWEITSLDGKIIFYTGDTGPGLSHLWKHVAPQILIIDTTFPDRFRKIAEAAGHLCPELLKKELCVFRKLKGYLPKVLLIHRHPEFESEIHAEIKAFEKELNAVVSMPGEGEIFTV